MFFPVLTFTNTTATRDILLIVDDAGRNRSCYTELQAGIHTCLTFQRAAQLEDMLKSNMSAELKKPTMVAQPYNLTHCVTSSPAVISL